MQQHRKDEQRINGCIAKKLKEFRLQGQLTHRQLAMISGLSGKEIEEFEKGTKEIYVDCLYRLALALNKPVDCFFEGIPDPPNKAGSQNRKEGKGLVSGVSNGKKKSRPSRLSHLFNQDSFICPSLTSEERGGRRLKYAG